MSKLLDIYASGTTTARLKRLLEKEYKRAEIMQVPKSLSKNGCSFGLKIEESDLKRLIELTKAIDVKHKGIYTENSTPEGKRYTPY